MSGAYDDLFGKPKVWLDGLTPEARSDIDELATAIVEHGTEPVWVKAWARFAERFPGEEPLTDTTFKATVRKLVADRG